MLYDPAETTVCFCRSTETKVTDLLAGFEASKGALSHNGKGACTMHSDVKEDDKDNSVNILIFTLLQISFGFMNNIPFNCFIIGVIMRYRVAV